MGDATVVTFFTHTVRIVFEMGLCFKNCLLLLGYILDFMFRDFFFARILRYVSMLNEASLQKKWIQLESFHFGIYCFSVWLLFHCPSWFYLCSSCVFSSQIYMLFQLHIMLVCHFLITAICYLC